MKIWDNDEAKSKSPYELFQRKRELKKFYFFREDVDRIIVGFPKIKFRYIVQPSVRLPSHKVPIVSKLEDIIF